MRHHAGTGKGFFIIAAAALCFASLAFAEEGAKNGPSRPEVEAEAAAFYGRVATFLGLEPGLVESVLPEFRREGVKTRDAVLVLIFAHKRTLRLFREEKITKDEVEKSFRASISEFLEKRRTRQNWREVICGELGLDVHDVTKQASNTVSEAMRPAAGARRSVPDIRAARPREVPEDLVQPLLQRLRVRPDTLKVAWGALGPIAEGTPRSGVILLILAKEKTDRLLEFGAVAQEDKEKVFFQSLADFIGQVEARPGIGWGNLASQVGLHSQDLQMEALSIFDAAGKRRQGREKAQGAQAREETPAVPRELSQW